MMIEGISVLISLFLLFSVVIIIINSKTIKNAMIKRNKIKS